MVLNSSSVSTKSLLAPRSKPGVWLAMRPRAARCHSAILAGVERKPESRQRYQVPRKRATREGLTSPRGSNLAAVRKVSMTGMSSRRLSVRYGRRRGQRGWSNTAIGGTHCVARGLATSLSDSLLEEKSERLRQEVGVEGRAASGSGSETSLSRENL
jgi:hypothetical protein